jgi:drug/metabolite transporter (DMT)-like permease
MPLRQSESWPLVALLMGAVSIAFAPILVRLSEVGPSATAFYRLALAAPVLVGWWQLESRSSRPSRMWRESRALLSLATAGLFFAADLSVWHWSIRFTSVANATLLANFAPVFVVLGSWLLFKQRFTKTFLLAVAIVLLGATLLIGNSLKLDPQQLRGDLLGLLTAVFYAGYILSVAHLRLRFSTVVIATWSSLVGSLILLPVALLSGETFIPVTAQGWSVLITLALVSQVGGQSLITYALAHLPAAFSAVGLLLQPVIATLLAWQIFGETLSLGQAVGGMIVLGGIALARQNDGSPQERS